MGSHCSLSSLHLYRHKYQDIGSPWARINQHSLQLCYKPIAYNSCAQCHLHQSKSSWRFSISASKINKYVIKLGDDPAKVSKKKGKITGAVALIIGTSIGSGILALPQKTSPAGLLPSSVTLIICWAFLVIEALLLVEINVGLMRKRRKRVEEDELEVISIRTMAQETLGEWGGVLATVIYVFLGYSSMVAYNSKSGEIINHLINIPYSVSGFLFPVLIAVLLLFGGTRVTDKVNQWLTVSMIVSFCDVFFNYLGLKTLYGKCIGFMSFQTLFYLYEFSKNSFPWVFKGLLLAIEVLAVLLGEWSRLDASGDWGKVPLTIPVIIFSLVYHDLAPVLCAYLGGDLQRIKVSVLLGSIVPLLALLAWDAIALGLSSHSSGVVDPIELLISMRWSGVSFMVEAFSLLAVGTSLIGTLLGFSEFFKEQINEFSCNSLSIKKQNDQFGLRKWWGKNKVSFTAIAMVIAPSLAVSTTIPDAFSTATDIAGGYCMTMLYGVFPPTMAWAMYNNRETEGKEDDEVIPTARPALIGVGLFASAIVLEQILQDLRLLHL